MHSLIVRRATPADSSAAVEVLRASITELCVLDHHGDPATLALWLCNKTTETFERWVAMPDGHVAIAERGAEVVGVGAIARGGVIHLLYVKPGCQGMGVGTALLQDLERVAAGNNVPVITLGSSSAARRFYEAHGYSAAGEPEPAFGVVLAHPYRKRL